MDFEIHVDVAWWNNEISAHSNTLRALEIRLENGTNVSADPRCVTPARAGKGPGVGDMKQGMQIDLDCSRHIVICVFYNAPEALSLKYLGIGVYEDTPCKRKKASCYYRCMLLS